MSKDSLKQCRVRCPFYCRDNGASTITCEGIVEDSTLNLNFATKADMHQQMEIFCCEYYKNCEVYRMLMEAKY